MADSSSLDMNVWPNDNKPVLYDPEGDAILVAGTEPARRIRVSTAQLAWNSPVFKAMFRGHFAEAQGLSASSPPDIDLPDDHPAALRALCALLHNHTDFCNPDNEAFHGKLQLLYHVLDLADKYQCIDSVRPVLLLHFRNRIPQYRTFRDLFLGYVCTFLLGDPVSLQFVAIRLASTFRGRASELKMLIESPEASRLPPSAVMCLLDLRYKAFHEITSLLHENVDGLLAELEEVPEQQKAPLSDCKRPLATALRALRNHSPVTHCLRHTVAEAWYICHNEALEGGSQGSPQARARSAVRLALNPVCSRWDYILRNFGMCFWCLADGCKAPEPYDGLCPEHESFSHYCWKTDVVRRFDSGWVDLNELDEPWA